VSRYTIELYRAEGDEVVDRPRVEYDDIDAAIAAARHHREERLADGIEGGASILCDGVQVAALYGDDTLEVFE
jgi:hypothetical protein